MQPEQQKKITEYFILEAQEHLQTIEHGLLNLAQTLQDQEIVDELFRAAHSIKGGAAMLGLTSIQTIAHRLEDYFKIFQDSSFEPDQRLEAYFLSLFTTLQELIEELSSPKGLAPEIAQNLLSKVEPVFKQLETHLHNLIAIPEATLEEEEETSPMTSSKQQNPQTVDQSFHKQVLLSLKGMLNLYKQQDSPENRQKLQQLCQKLADLGKERNIAPWIVLLEASGSAITVPENSYRSCVGIVIKEIKKAREKILADSPQEITINKQLQTLLPVEFEQASTTSNRAPEVGMAAINSLADLFEEEEGPDLETTWQEEEVIEEENIEGEFTSPHAFFDQEENDQERAFDEPFLDMDEEDEISSAENLVNLFEDDFEEEITSSSATMTNSQIDPSERLDEVADLMSSSGFASEEITDNLSFEEEISLDEETTANDLDEFSLSVAEEGDPEDNLNALFTDMGNEVELPSSDTNGGVLELDTIPNGEEETDDLDTLFELDESDSSIGDANGEVLELDTTPDDEEDIDNLLDLHEGEFLSDSEQEETDNLDNLDTLFELDEGDSSLDQTDGSALDLDSVFTEQEETDDLDTLFGLDEDESDSSSEQTNETAPDIDLNSNSLNSSETDTFDDLLTINSHEQNLDDLDDFLQSDIHPSHEVNGASSSLQAEQDLETLDGSSESTLANATEEKEPSLAMVEEEEDFDDLLAIGSDSSEGTSLDRESPSDEGLDSFDDLLAIGSEYSPEPEVEERDDIPTGNLGFGDLLDSENIPGIEAEVDLSSATLDSFDLDAFADSQESSNFTDLNDLFEEEIARESSQLDNTFSNTGEDDFSFDFVAPDQDLDNSLPEITAEDEEDLDADNVDLNNQSSQLNGSFQEDLNLEENISLEDLSLDMGGLEEEIQEDNLDLDTSLEDDLGLDLSFLEEDSASDNSESEEEVSLDDLDALLNDSQDLEIEADKEDSQSLDSLFDWDEGDFESKPEKATIEKASSSVEPAEETLEYYCSFEELEALIQEDSTAQLLAELNGVGAFEQLETLIHQPPSPDSPQEHHVQATSLADVPQPNASEDEFGDLEDLLKDIESQVGGAPSVVPRSGQKRPAAGNSQKKSSIFEQTLKVPVRQLDNLINLMGELVVNRNGLEKDQEMLRQSLDNLLQQAGNLSDVGSRMQDLYERSLLESSLLASRQRHNRPTVAIDTGNHRDNGDNGDQGYDPLEMDRFSGFHLLSQEMIELVVRVRESASDIGLIVEEVDQVARNLRHVTGQMQEGLTTARMVPFERTASRLPIAVKRVSQELNKEAQLQLEGRETLIDKMILEHLSDPLTHLVNNALYHGIESAEVRTKAGKSPVGKITVSAFHQGNQTIITITDDGGGIPVDVVKRKAVQKGLISASEAEKISDQEVYSLLFHAGFSTNDQADNFAGRGVGMDVVRSSIMEIRGTVAIDSELGKGTIFTIRLPLNLSISPALCCRVENTSIAFPMDGVEDVVDISPEQVQTNEAGETFIHWRDNLLAFKPITELLAYNRRLGRRKMYRGKRQDELISILVLRSAGNFIAVEVDQVLEEQEIVIKQLTGPVPKPLGIAGATVLGDGRVMPIADVLELMDLFQGRGTSRGTWQENNTSGKSTLEISQSEPMVLIVDDSITVRELLSITFNKAGYRVEQARDGQEAWEKLRSGLPCDIVFCDIEMPRMNGLELLGRLQKDEQLKDLPIAMLTSRGAARHKEAAAELGANGYFTKPYLEENLLDGAQRMIQGEVLLEGSTRVSRPKNSEVPETPPVVEPEAPTLTKETITQEDHLVLIIDDSIVVRELLSETFTKAGYNVEQARDGQEAWEKLKDGLMCDLAFCDIEMPRMNGLDLLANLQKDEELSKLPVAMLTSRGAQKHRQIAAERGAKGYFTKPYVEATLLDAAEKLLAGEMLIETGAQV